MESLEKALDSFDYGIFIFTPDDGIILRQQDLMITRDNVIFELGMFIGKMSRRRTFIIHPRDNDLHILTDLDGISKATYDCTNDNLTATLNPACEQIREAISNVK
jgi:predicted nucleotide-binding protein